MTTSIRNPNAADEPSKKWLAWYDRQHGLWHRLIAWLKCWLHEEQQPFESIDPARQQGTRQWLR